MREIRRIIVHHSGSPRSTTVEQIRQWHLDRGWSDIGYHCLVDARGRYHGGRPFHLKGAHARGHNADSVGLCLIGDNTTARSGWTEPQAQRARDVIRALRLLYPGIEEVIAHRDVGNTVCPATDIRSWGLI